VPDARPDLTGRPVALFVFSNLREQKGGLTRAWLRRLMAFHEAGWDTHVATIHPQPEIDETLAAWRERGWLPEATPVHHYQRRDKRFRPSWSRRTDETFTRDDRVADWLDWLVGRLPGVVVFADSPVTYAPVAMMRNPFVGRIMTVHLAHRKGEVASAGDSGVDHARPRRVRQVRSRYAGPVGQPRLSGRLLPFAPVADAVVALTHGQAEHLRQDVPGLEVHVIPNMVDAAPPRSTPGGRDPLRVVQLGRLDAVKRVDHAMRAVGLAAQVVPGVHLEVHGRGPELEHLLELRAELGLEEVVSFPGFTDDPMGVLAAAAVSLMTSRREGFGLAVAESLAVGTPVVTYDVDYGPAELVQDGVNGRVVRDGSVEQLAEALVQILSAPEAWERMSLAAPEATARLHPDVVAGQWLALATEVAGRIDVPDSAVLVEDVRVRRAGVLVAGVAVCRPPASPPATLGVADGPGEPLGGSPWPGADGSPAGRPSTHARDVSADLTWDAIAAWPQGAQLTASDLTGAPVPVLGPGLPVAVCPTESGPVLVGCEAPDGLVRRLPDRGPVAVSLRRTSARASLDEDVTILSDVPVVRATILRSTGTRIQAAVELLPGLAVSGEVELTVVAGTGTTSVAVGQLTAPAPSPDASARGSVTGSLELDPSALQALLGSGASPAPVWLSAARSLKAVGPVSMAPGEVVDLDLGRRWVLAGSASGRALLVPGRGLRVRAGHLVRRWVARRAKV
jgi:glycosyltransferase involved in cell wall biosynthesis